MTNDIEKFKIKKIDIVGDSARKNINKMIDAKNELDYHFVESVQRKERQPFITNENLEEIIKSQTPKWVSYAAIIISIISLIVAIIAYFQDLSLP